ncbi:hypothetical protein FRAHR75_3420001 [Frankia sp. Hr75.2]|nr:hypothetical protein FRAHR75_3420001 [Frankia sp. Hr75.2]
MVLAVGPGRSDIVFGFSPRGGVFRSRA